jgi:hypothetical protein
VLPDTVYIYIKGSSFIQVTKIGMLADETSRLQVLIRKKQENAIIVLMPNKQGNKKDA